MTKEELETLRQKLHDEVAYALHNAKELGEYDTIAQSSSLRQSLLPLSMK